MKSSKVSVGVCVQNGSVVEVFWPTGDKSDIDPSQSIIACSEEQADKIVLQATQGPRDIASFRSRVDRVLASEDNSGSNGYKNLTLHGASWKRVEDSMPCPSGGTM